MTLKKLAIALEDVRPFCLEDPERARRLIEKLKYDPINNQLPNKVSHRIWRNIGDGLGLIDEAPALLEAYLFAAAVDIRVAARMAEVNPEPPMTWERARQILGSIEDDEV